MRVLFVCVHNSGRSQMAEAFFNRSAQGTATAQSAGTQPEEQVNPAVVQAMVEVGIDLSKKRPQLLTQEMLDEADRVITMGCNVEEACPANMVLTEDWALEDPKGKSLAKVREIRDQIEARVVKMLAEADV
ncbi:MAG: arsenate reductase ArsC [Chloroflexi bacterium]|nr:arsenate reductase ArsC [Chloroflexota bacterium]